MGRIPNSLALVELPFRAVVRETEGMKRVICRHRSKPGQNFSSAPMARVDQLHGRGRVSGTLPAAALTPQRVGANLTRWQRNTNLKQDHFEVWPIRPLNGLVVKRVHGLTSDLVVAASVAPAPPLLPASFTPFIFTYNPNSFSNRSVSFLKRRPI